MIELQGIKTQVIENIIPYIQSMIPAEQFDKMYAVLHGKGLLDRLESVTHYIGKRKDEPVGYLQIDIKDHDSLYMVIG